MVQLGFYFHMKRAMGSASLTLTRPLAFATSFMLFVSVVIALFKDIPDIKGDRKVRQDSRRYLKRSISLPVTLISQRTVGFVDIASHLSTGVFKQPCCTIHSRTK